MVDEMGHSGVLWEDTPGGRRMTKRYMLEDFTCKYCGSGTCWQAAW